MGQVLISFVYFAKFNSDAGISQNRNFPSDGLTKNGFGKHFGPNKMGWKK